MDVFQSLVVKFDIAAVAVMTVIFCAICIRPNGNPWDSDYNVDIFRKQSSSSFHIVVMPSKLTQGCYIATVLVAVVSRKGTGARGALFLSAMPILRKRLSIHIYTSASHYTICSSSEVDLIIHYVFPISSPDIEKKNQNGYCFFFFEKPRYIFLINHPSKRFQIFVYHGVGNTCVCTHPLGADLHTCVTCSLTSTANA